MTTPLAGITVLDFGQIYQGPYATMLMAKAGANVIKIEPPGGEPLRRRVIATGGWAAATRQDQRGTAERDADRGRRVGAPARGHARSDRARGARGGRRHPRQRCAGVGWRGRRGTPPASPPGGHAESARGTPHRRDKTFSYRILGTWPRSRSGRWRSRNRFLSRRRVSVRSS